MTVFRLILRNLLYFKGVNIAVIAGVAVATAVMSGALMVGDSVRASLTDLAVQSLEKIDHALISGRYFDASLVERMIAEPQIQGRFDIVPAVVVRGGATRDSNSARTAGMQIMAVGGHWVAVKPGECILNSQAAEALDIREPGVEIVLSLPAESDLPRDATLARRSRQDSLSGLRVRVADIVSEPGMISLFSPKGGQRAPQNAWVNLTDLQNAIGQRAKANTLFAHDMKGNSDGAAHLNKVLRRVISLGDYGLAIAPVRDTSEAALTSANTYLGIPVELTADRITADIPQRKISVNLFNAVNRVSEDGKTQASIHYAVAAGVSPLDSTELAEDEIALNEWTAERLGAKVGDRLSFTFYLRQTNGNLAEVSNADRGFNNPLRVARSLRMSGVGADTSLTPTYKGLTDADSIASWDPPDEVKIDKKLVTPADEAYWKQYKAAPKLFVSFSTAQKLWGTAIGNTTSIRIPLARSDEFAKTLLAQLDPMMMGMIFRPLRQEQIAAAGGTTDFGQLFIGFSFFLIIAAALLVAMLFRLSVEQRARQIGAMSALGFSAATLRKVMLSEGMLLSVWGGIIGSFAAVGYTALMMSGLRTWWIGAIGTTAMHLHVVPTTLAIGFISGQFVALLAIWWALRQIGRAAPARLLAGGWESTRALKSSSGRVYHAIAIVGLISGLAIIVIGILNVISQQAAFIISGTILLVSGLCLFSGQLQPRARGNLRSAAQLGIRNTTRHTARSVLCIGLIALAAFALVTVAAMRQGEPSDTGDIHSGSGGYRLIVESEIPLLGNPATEQGRSLLGFREPTAAIWNRVEFLSTRRRAGQDISCLNLTQPTNPTILAVPPSLIQQGGFTRGQDNPWKLLERTDSTGEIPVITDESTATYILHIKHGQTLPIIDSLGAVRQLRLVATLSNSIFQGALLMSEEHFRQMFPDQAGFGLVLARVNPVDQDQVRRLLSDELNEYGANVRTTASVLAGYLEIQNTYLSTFELLGALGLMLGTIGLAVVLVRNVIERKAELALLTSLGFSRGLRIKLVLVENAFLLISGLALGTICAVIGVLPALRESARGINISSLAITLAATLFIGLLASAAAVMFAGTRVSAAELRKE